MYPTIFDTEELTALREMARKFASEKLAPGYKARERAGAFGPDILREMGSLGLIAPELPEELGGLGAGSIYSGVIIEEIARADFNMGYINILASLNGQILARFGNDEIKRDWLPKLTAGELMVAIALTEPRGGSDAANLGLKMERVGDHYVLNGEKTSISAADQAKGAVVFARSGRPEDRARGISAIFVPMDTPGISTTRFSDLGQHAIGRGSIFFDNVRVPAANLLGEEGKGFKYLMQKLPQERLLISVQCQARAEAAFDWTVQYVQERQAFRQRLADFQNTRFKLGALAADLAAGRAYCDQLLAQHLAGELDAVGAAAGKLWHSELLGRVTDECLQLFGGYGYMHEYPIARAWSDARIERIYGGTSEIMKEIIARDLLDGR